MNLIVFASILAYMTRAEDERDLYHAIGRVACESANMEELLRIHIVDAIGFTETVTLLFQGQSMDWLIGTIKALYKVPIEGLTEDNPRWGEAARDYELVSNCLANLSPLRDLRNFVIHGSWHLCSYNPAHGDPRLECILADPPLTKKGDGDLRVFHFQRSRTRRFDTSQRHFTISEVEELADAFISEAKVIRNVLSGAKFPHLAF